MVWLVSNFRPSLLPKSAYLCSIGVRFKGGQVPTGYSTTRAIQELPIGSKAL